MCDALLDFIHILCTYLRNVWYNYRTKYTHAHSLYYVQSVSDLFPRRDKFRSVHHYYWFFFSVNIQKTTHTSYDVIIFKYFLFTRFSKFFFEMVDNRW